MAILISRTYEMQAAHQLHLGVPENHPCRRLHGHRYVLTVTVRGAWGLDASGMVAEYTEIDHAVAPAVSLVDHWSLNTLGERAPDDLAATVSQNPTVERLAGWFAERIGIRLPSGVLLARLRLEEDSCSAAEWTP